MGHTRRRGIGVVLALAVVLAVFGSRAEGQSVEISPLNKAEGLDLSGNIIYAINFGNNGSPTVGGIVFAQDEECAGITVGAADFFEATASGWGPPAGTEDAGLNLLLSGFAATAIASDVLRIDAQGLVPGALYLLQIIGYEPESHSRKINIVVEDKQIVTGLNPFAEQGGVVGKGGLVVKYRFTASDPVLNIHMVNHESACALSGLVLTELTRPSFADYGSGTTTELVSGKGTWQVNWGQGPWTWSDSEGESMFGANVSSVLALQTTAAANVSAELVATLPIAGTLTLSAHDPSNGVVIGTMTLSGSGVNIVDLNATRATVDEECGMCMVPFHPPGPEVSMTMADTTGVFAYIRQVGDWRLQLAGLYAAPLMKGVGIQDGIMSALSGKVPLIGGLGVFELTGQYEADESKRPHRFCEYGTGVTLRLSAGGGLWDQDWSGGPWTWHECPAAVNATFLGDNVSGELETTTAGAPTIDQNLVLSFDFGGHISLTKNGANADEIDGQIRGDVEGVFVANLNAEYAATDADGNIVIAFGVSVHDAPDALITVTEATGVYADIRQAGQWAWYVNGAMAVTRLPDLSIQDNIMAALQNNDLILRAEEQFVLTGWYYRDSEGQ